MLCLASLRLRMAANAGSRKPSCSLSTISRGRVSILCGACRIQRSWPLSTNFFLFLLNKGDHWYDWVTLYFGDWGTGKLRVTAWSSLLFICPEQAQPFLGLNSLLSCPLISFYRFSGIRSLRHLATDGDHYKTSFRVEAPNYIPFIWELCSWVLATAVHYFSLVIAPYRTVSDSFMGRWATEPK